MAVEVSSSVGTPMEATTTPTWKATQARRWVTGTGRPFHCQPMGGAMVGVVARQAWFQMRSGNQ